MDGLKFTVISTLPCPAEHFLDRVDWQLDQREKVENTLYFICPTEFETIFGEEKHELAIKRTKIINLSIFAQNLVKPDLVKFLSEIIIEAKVNSYQAVYEAYMKVLVDNISNPVMINIIEGYFDGKLWKHLAKKAGMKYRNKAIDIEPYLKYRDIFGIYIERGIVRMGLYTRSSSLRKKRYLPLIDPTYKDVMVEYVKFKPTNADITKYKEILDKFDTSSFIIHPYFSDSHLPTLYDYIKLCITTAINLKV